MPGVTMDNSFAADPATESSGTTQLVLDESSHVGQTDAAVEIGAMRSRRGSLFVSFQ
jgi:hypothetical protein